MRVFGLQFSRVHVSLCRLAGGMFDRLLRLFRRTYSKLPRFCFPAWPVDPNLQPPLPYLFKINPFFPPSISFQTKFDSTLSVREGGGGCWISVSVHLSAWNRTPYANALPQCILTSSRALCTPQMCPPAFPLFPTPPPPLHLTVHAGCFRFYMSKFTTVTFFFGGF